MADGNVGKDGRVIVRLAGKDGMFDILRSIARRMAVTAPCMVEFISKSKLIFVGEDVGDLVPRCCCCCCCCFVSSLVSPSGSSGASDAGVMGDGESCWVDFNSVLISLLSEAALGRVLVNEAESK